MTDITLRVSGAVIGAALYVLALLGTRRLADFIDSRRRPTLRRRRHTPKASER